MIARARTFFRVALGGGCVVIMTVWAVPFVVAVASDAAEDPSRLETSEALTPTSDPAEKRAVPSTSPEVIDGGGSPGRPRGAAVNGVDEVVVSVPLPTFDVDPERHSVRFVGCIDDLDATSMREFVSARIGPLVGWDNPHIYAIDGHRVLWILHDSYLDDSGTARSIDDIRPQLQNLVILQEGSCFTLVHGGTPGLARQNFEIGDGRGHGTEERFLWPLGAAVDGDVLWLFWSETVLSDNSVTYGGGAVRHPEKVWLASYDVDTLERLSFDEAPNSGVFPSYGFAVESDDEHSYLFGNSNLLNFVREGGYENGPHSATKMFLARVPRGQLDEDPEYWNGSSWTNEATQAVPISERFWAENTMQPRYIDGRWMSVVKRDGFFGNELVVDVAENPWGPWEVAERIPHDPQAAVPMNSYHPVIAPWSSADNGLIIIVSENAQDWDLAIERLDLYRPSVTATDWPFPDDLEAPSGVSSGPHG